MMPQKPYLREQTREVFHAFYRGLVQDPDLFAEESDFSPWRYDKETVDKLYDRRLSQRDRRSWAVMLDGECIGDVSLKHIDRAENCAEMEICLQRDEFKNRGIGTEAERQLLAIAFGELGLGSVKASVLRKNTRSAHVLEKLFFSRTGEEGDFLLYRITASEWSGNPCAHSEAVIK